MKPLTPFPLLSNPAAVSIVTNAIGTAGFYNPENTPVTNLNCALNDVMDVVFLPEKADRDTLRAWFTENNEALLERVNHVTKEVVFMVSQDLVPVA